MAQHANFAKGVDRLMSKWKKHLALPLLMGVVICMLTAFFSIHEKQDETWIKLSDIAGDRNDALAGVIIRGELRDGYHRTAFSIEDGKVKLGDTDIFGQPHYENIRSVGIDFRLNDSEFSIENYYGNNNYKIRRRLLGSANDISGAEFRTQVYYHRPTGGRGISFSNHFSYGLTELNDTYYFTVPTSEYFSGSNAIYHLNFSKGRDKEPSNAIMRYSLDQNQEDGQKKLEVLGLEATGDQLAIILEQGDQLLIRGITEDGELTGETIVPNFSMQEHRNEYRTYRDDEQQRLVLEFIHRDSTMKTWITLEFTNGVQWLENVSGSFRRSMNEREDVSLARYMNDRLYVLQTISVPMKNMRLSIYEKQLFVHVYEYEKRIYEGQLQTDINDDLIRDLNKQRGGSYYLREHRQIEGLQLLRKEGES